jgi:uncharacterized surface protein with fasciclin (FAS1) repeats
MKKLLFVLLVVLALLVVACCPTPEPSPTSVPEPTDEPAPPTPMPTEVPPTEAPKDIVDVAVEADSFETLVAAVQAAGLEDALRGEGPFTVFAPTDDAFAALPEGTVEALLADPEGDLQQILLYHVVPGQVMAADVSDGLMAETLQGGSVTFAVDGDMVTIDGATIVATDIEASNGVIHVIDAVILPPKDIVDTAIEAGDFSTLVAAVQAAGLEDALRGEGPFTVFAPADAAFDSLPDGTIEALLADPEGQLKRILEYHVIPGKVMAADVSDGLMAETLRGASVTFAVDGDMVTIDGATIVATDIEASNGVIHVIDAVIMPPQDIVDVAVEAGSFTTLVAAVQAAGLEDALRGKGPFTVFAPTDAAFDSLPDGTIEALLADPEGDLQQILLYHVVPGKVMAADVSDGLMAETLQGSSVTFAVHGDGAVTIDDARIVTTDIEASNGVIHVIDAVILPPKDIVDTAIEAGDFETLVAAVQAAGLEDALRGEGPFTVFAPTDAAFAALPDGTMEALLADPEGDLQQILLYHVIPGQVMAADVTDGLEAETLQGGTVTFAVHGDGTVTINDAMIVITDIKASNGVIHVIDAVILPE